MLRTNLGQIFVLFVSLLAEDGRRKSSFPLSQYHRTNDLEKRGLFVGYIRMCPWSTPCNQGLRALVLRWAHCYWWIAVIPYSRAVYCLLLLPTYVYLRLLAFIEFLSNAGSCRFFVFPMVIVTRFALKNHRYFEAWAFEKYFWFCS